MRGHDHVREGLGAAEKENKYLRVRNDTLRRQIAEAQDLKRLVRENEKLRKLNAEYEKVLASRGCA